ncbi:hypothetical protein evm_003405 [Chilo suppressalis]|nr:hypothetical protein evm_003405 [Chilo suppressalis]
MTMEEYQYQPRHDKACVDRHCNKHPVYLRRHTMHCYDLTYIFYISQKGAESFLELMATTNSSHWKGLNKNCVSDPWLLDSKICVILSLWLAGSENLSMKFGIYSSLLELNLELSEGLKHIWNSTKELVCGFSDRPYFYIKEDSKHIKWKGPL